MTLIPKNDSLVIMCTIIELFDIQISGKFIIIMRTELYLNKIDRL